MSAAIPLGPGERLRLPPGSTAILRSGHLNAAAVPFHDDAPDDAPDGAGLHLSSLAPGDLAIALPDDRLAIELAVITPAVVTLHPTADGIDPDALDRWLRAVERLGAWTPASAPRAVFPGPASMADGEIIAAPRDRVVWIAEPAGWTVLTDGAPRAWSGAQPSVTVVTTADLAGAQQAALAAWSEATAARLAAIVTTQPARRAQAIAAATAAVATARTAARAVISGHPGPPHATSGGPVAAAFARAVPGADPGPESSITDPSATGPIAAALEAAAQAGIGARVVRLDQPLAGELGPKLLATTTETPPRLLAVLPAAHGYTIADPAAPTPGSPGRTPLAARAVALTEPLPAALAAAIGHPARIFAALLAGSPADSMIALLWGLGGIATAAAMPVAVDLLFTAIWPRADLASHWLLIGGLAVIALASIAFAAAQSLRAGRLVLRFTAMLENGLWLALVRARPRDLASSAGDTQQRLAAASRLRHLLAGQPMRFAIDLGALAVNLALMGVYGGALAWIGVAAVLLLGLCRAALLLPATSARTEHEELGGRQTALLAQAIAAITKVKATASENFILARWAGLADRRRHALRRAERAETIGALAAAAIGGAATAAVFALAGLVLSRADGEAGITLGAFLAFQVSLGQAIAAATSAAGLLSAWPALAAAGARLRPLATLPPEITARRATPPALEGAITISRVTHHYPGTDAPSLDAIDLEIGARDYVAIVGASGSGKSTLLRILLGLEQPTHGAVYFDGLDATQVDPAALRRQIGYVGQDQRLSPGSILENILDGRPAGAPAAWEAARLAGLAPEIDAMPMGMQTLVGEAGQNISGGQRQRIMIARAVLSRPRILILDEATRALDNRVQALVQNGLAELPVTRIVVAHRLSTIQGVDRVFVLSRGRLVEAGPPADLLRRNGPFAALAGRQMLDPARQGDG